VHDVAFVEVFECFCDGFEYLFGLWFWEAVLGFGEEVVVEGVGAAVLLDEVDFCVAFDGFDEAGDDWVVEFGEDVDLPLEVAEFVGFVEFAFVVYFDGYFLVGAFVEAHFHHSVRALPQLLVDLVVF
jgi:hypothetical protein